MNETPDPNPEPKPLPANPYLAPQVVESADDVVQHVRSTLAVPVTALALIGVITVVVDVVGTLAAVIELLRSLVYVSSATDLMFRAVMVISWGCCVLLVHAVSLYGCYRIWKLQNHQECVIACLVAMVPGCSPGIVLGIPFAIWTLILLGRERTHQAYETQKQVDAKSAAEKESMTGNMTGKLETKGKPTDFS